MALGVVEAVKSASSLDKVAVVGTDGIREAKKSVGAGEMRATVAEFPYEEGKLGVQMALRLLGCQAIPQWIVSPQAVITKENVKDFPNPKVTENCDVDLDIGGEDGESHPPALLMTGMASPSPGFAPSKAWISA